MTVRADTSFGVANDPELQTMVRISTTKQRALSLLLAIQQLERPGTPLPDLALELRRFFGGDR